MTPFVYARDVKSAVNERQCQALARLAEGKQVLELGSWLGRSTIALASTAKRVYSVDRHTGDKHTGQLETYDRFIFNLERYGVSDKVSVWVGEFEIIVPQLPITFDLVFVDGQHDARSIKRDGELAISVLSVGGILAFHDYGSIYDPIQEYVDHIVDQYQASMWTVGTLAVVEGVCHGA
jgi:predicted O-methyltransferase YrrM